jgi:hypothetical protein
MVLDKPLEIAGHVTGGGPPFSLFFILALMPGQMHRATLQKPASPISVLNCFLPYFAFSVSL